MVDWLSAAERLAAIDRSKVQLDPQRCLHSTDKFSSCNACFDFCPVQAIWTVEDDRTAEDDRDGKPPQLDAARCISCLACLPVCPVDAFTADDAVAALLTCAARVDSDRFELACQLHPDAHLGWTDAAVGIRVRGCLAGLGVGAYLGLAALDLKQVVVRTDACSECPLASLQSQIETQVANARRLLAFYGKAGLLTCTIPSIPDQCIERPLWDADNPPLSRRDLFRLASRQGQVAAARALSKGEERPGHRPSRQHQRLIGVVRHLQAAPADPDAPLDGFGYARLSVTGDCTACGICARVCPTGALRFSVEEDHYRLSHSAEICSACETCLHTCAFDALRIDHTPSFAQVFLRSEPVVLVEGDFVTCERCSTRFNAQAGKRLCPVCEFRRQHPFGSALPPGLQAQMSKQKEAGRHDC